MTRIRIVLPHHLRELAEVESPVELEVADPPTLAGALDALEAALPVLKGTVRDHGSGARRAYLRFYACGRDLSHDPLDTELPPEVVEGGEPLRVLGAISGG